MDEDSEAFGLGAKIRSESDISDYEGKSVLLLIASEDKSVPMMVTEEGTDAKEDGNDVMFLLCSEKCSVQLKAALDRELRIGELFMGINPL